MRKKLTVLSVLLTTIPAYSIAQETKIPYEFTDGQPARASEINANFRSLHDAVNSLGKQVQDYRNESITTIKNTALTQEERLNELRSLITTLQNDLIKLKQNTTSISGSRDPVNDKYGVQELGHLTASVTKLVVSPKHDVAVFIKYKSKEKTDYYIGLSGCSTDWRKKSYLVDDVGNIYTIKTASGIGYVGCGWINDPVLLKAGGIATFTIIFERPRSVDKFGSAYSLSIAQHLGTLNADGKWKNAQDFNISIGDVRPNK